MTKKAKGKLGVFKAPGGNVKSIGKTGQFIGGLDPLVVKPTPGVAPRRVAPAIFRVGPVQGGKK